MRTPSMATGSPFSNSICSREGAARAHVGAARASWAWERPGRSSCAHTSKQGGSFTHLDVGGLVGRLLGRHRPCEHRLRGLHPWVFQRIAAQREGRGVSSLEGCAGGQGAGEGGSLRGAWFLGSCSPSAGRRPPPRLLTACPRPRGRRRANPPRPPPPHTHTHVPSRSPLIRDVQHVCVHGEGGLAALGLGNLDAVALGKLDHLSARVEVPLAPGGDDLDVRLEAIVAARSGGSACVWGGRVGVERASSGCASSEARTAVRPAQRSAEQQQLAPAPTPPRTHSRLTHALHARAHPSSNRTWSLPLPVAPWETASPPTSSAISIWRLAISGRAIEVPSRYTPS